MVHSKTLGRTVAHFAVLSGIVMYCLLTLFSIKPSILVITPCNAFYSLPFVQELVHCNNTVTIIVRTYTLHSYTTSQSFSKRCVFSTYVYGTLIQFRGHHDLTGSRPVQSQVDNVAHSEFSLESCRAFVTLLRLTFGLAKIQYGELSNWQGKLWTLLYRFYSRRYLAPRAGCGEHNLRRLFSCCRMPEMLYVLRTFTYCTSSQYMLVLVFEF